MNENRVAADEAYNPSVYARGVGADVDSDSCGLPPAKHSAFALEIDLGDEGGCLLYGHLAGGPSRDKDYTLIEVPFSGWYRHEGQWQDGVWLAVIRGTNLKSVFGHIRDARRMSVHNPQSKPPADKACVTGVTVRLLVSLGKPDS